MCLIMVCFVSIIYPQSTSNTATAFEVPYSPANRPRMAAEWEPAVGVLISWPLALPYKLVIQLSKDTKLYVLVESRARQQEVIKAFTKWGIFPDRVRFITLPQGDDAFWTRDWGPHAIFDHTGQFKLADPSYLYSTPLSGYSCQDSLDFIYRDDAGKVILTREEDEAPWHVAGSLGLETINLPFALTGGNILTDGQGTAFSTCVLGNENRMLGVSDEKFFASVKQLLGLDTYHMLSNFDERGIQHIDCYMKLLDEERILVLRPPADHPDFEQYEGIVEHELKPLKTTYGRPYQILRLDTDRYEQDKLAAYSNALILNQHIYVPLYGIPQDATAIEQWQQAMPGYTVRGYEYNIATEPDVDPEIRRHYTRLGWNAEDALHCRTRAIWDSEMLYLSINRIPDRVPRAKDYPVYVLARDYSAQGLKTNDLKLYWRVQPETKWKEIRLKPTNIPDQFEATIPGQMAGVTIDYYISAASESGRMETMPRTAPAGLYHFTID